MATKTFCDACGKEGNVTKFQYLCHLTDLAQGKFTNGYVDKDWNSISGRSDSVDLCNKCYNEVVIKAVKHYYEIRKLNDRA